MMPRRTGAGPCAGLLILTVAAALCVGSVRAQEGNAGNPGVLPLGSTPFGMSYAEWHTAYWNWLMSIPADTNPSYHVSGDFDASVGQTGHVWFLPGTHGWDVVRDATIPSGTPLCVSLQSYLVWGWPNVPPAVAAFSNYLTQVADTSAVSCEIDGVPVDNPDLYTGVSPATPMVLPEDNLPGYPAGTYGMKMDFGSFLLLAPLSVGQHTLHWHAEFTLLPAPPPPGSPPPPPPPYPRASQDVTYLITVVPSHGK